jgi:mono/diheme cytochrome c family protein
MKKAHTLYKAFAVILACSVLTSYTVGTTPWKAPASANAVVNPSKGDEKATAEGKKLYAQLCSVCHGEKGKGDGIAASGLTPKPADHTSDLVQGQTDGAIFWKLTTGRSPMAGYEKSLTEKQRWALINFIRTLKKGGGKTTAGK